MPANEKEVMRIVCQRVVSGRLLVDAENNQWCAVPSPGGLVFLTGFQVETADQGFESAQICGERLRRAAHSVLGAPLACGHDEGWQEDHSEEIALSELLSSPRPVSIAMIPQACLAGTIPLGQKSVKYNRQVGKQRARELWLQWVAAVAAMLCELVAPPSEEEQAVARIAEATAVMKAKTAEAPVNPCEMFKDGSWGKFSTFDEDGFPLTDEKGEPVSKSQMKKLVRVHKQQHEKWQRYMGKQQEQDPSAAAPRTNAFKHSSHDPLPEWLAADATQGGAIVIRGDGSVSRLAAGEAADSEQFEGERARLVWGTFGGRQSWEAVSNDPFTHAVSF